MSSSSGSSRFRSSTTKRSSKSSSSFRASSSSKSRSSTSTHKAEKTTSTSSRYKPSFTRTSSSTPSSSSSRSDGAASLSGVRVLPSISFGPSDSQLLASGTPTSQPFSTPSLLPTSSDSEVPFLPKESAKSSSSSSSSPIRWIALGVCTSVFVLFLLLGFYIIQRRKRRLKLKRSQTLDMEKDFLQTKPPVIHWKKSPSRASTVDTVLDGFSSVPARSGRQLVVLPTLQPDIEAQTIDSKPLALAAQTTPALTPNTGFSTDNPFASPKDAHWPSSPTDSMYSQISATSTVRNALDPFRNYSRSGAARTSGRA